MAARRAESARDEKGDPQPPPKRLNQVRDNELFEELAGLDPNHYPEHAPRANQLFGEIHRRYDRQLRQIAASILKYDSSVDDVLQKAFTKAWLHRARAVKNPSPERWLIGIVKREALTEVRRKTRAKKREHPLDAPMRGAGSAVLQSFFYARLGWGLTRMGLPADTPLIRAEARLSRERAARILKFALLQMALESNAKIPPGLENSDQTLREAIDGAWRRFIESGRVEATDPFLPTRGFLRAMLLHLHIGVGVPHKRIVDAMRAVLSARRLALQNVGCSIAEIMAPEAINVSWAQQNLARAKKVIREYLRDNDFDLDDTSDDAIG